MRLKHIYISDYKNLKDFSLKFEGDSFIDVFVGKNGTGKSNLFEAIIEIFRQLFEKEYKVNFEYVIEYEINEEVHFIKWDWTNNRYLNNQNEEVPKISKVKLPDNILIYYSGHNEKVINLIHEYEEEFKKDLKEANEGDTREFIGIGKDYKALLLTVLLLQPNTCKAKQFIIQKLGITPNWNELHITLKRPYYSYKNGYDVDPFEDSTRFWKAKGITKNFMDVLHSIARTTKIGERDEEYIPQTDPEKKSYDDKYELYLDIEDFQNKFEQLPVQDLFRSFDNLKTIEMLVDITLSHNDPNVEDNDINWFSDGQFQSIYIYTIMELFKDKNCLTLLDEPDSFLHPEWQFDFMSQVFDITKAATVNNHVLMTSHSAITLLNSQEKRINLFTFKDNNIISNKVKKSYAVRQLSSNLINVQHDKQILSVIHTIGQNKPILFTEGYSDPVILNHAWSQLYEEEIPFEICFGHGCLYLRLLLQSDKLINEMGTFPIFGLFDFDMAYNEWNSINGEEDLVEANPYKGLTKKILNKNSYAILVPVPDVPLIKKQVIKDGNKTFKENSKLEVEHLFYSETTAGHFHKVSVVGGGELIEINDSLKMKFATEVVPHIAKENFEVLRPIFDFIKSKC